VTTLNSGQKKIPRDGIKKIDDRLVTGMASWDDRRRSILHQSTGAPATVEKQEHQGSPNSSQPIPAPATADSGGVWDHWRKYQAKQRGHQTSINTDADANELLDPREMSLG
jgi:hypothetical protein